MGFSDPMVTALLLVEEFSSLRYIEADTVYVGICVLQ